MQIIVSFPSAKSYSTSMPTTGLCNSGMSMSISFSVLIKCNGRLEKLFHSCSMSVSMLILWLSSLGLLDNIRIYFANSSFVVHDCISMINFYNSCYFSCPTSNLLSYSTSSVSLSILYSFTYKFSSRPFPHYNDRCFIR